MRNLLLFSLYVVLNISLSGQSLLSLHNFQDVVSASSVVTGITVSDVTISAGSIGFQNGNDDGGTRIGNSGSWNTGNFSTSEKYLQFSITPNINYEIEYSSLTFRFGRTAQGPTRVTIQYSLDNFATAGTTVLDNGTVSSTDAASLDVFTINTGLPVGDITQTLTIRIWGHNSVGTGNFRFNNFRVFGTVTLNIPEVNFYSKNTGELNNLGTWGNNIDGTGTSPSDFTSDGQIFNIRNNAVPTIISNWTVSGSGSKVIVGNGTDVCNFIIPSDFTLSGIVDVSANASLTIQNTTLPTFGTLNSNSTIVYDGTSAQSINQVTYGNLTLSSSGTKTFSGGTTTVNGNLIFNDCAITAPGSSPFATIALGGNLTYIGSVTNPADANSITLLMQGSSLQTITANGNIVRFFRITMNNASGAELSNIGGSSNALVGNNSGGGLTFTAGSLTTNTNTVTLFESTNSNVLTEDNGKYLIGNLTVTKSVGTGSSTFGGIGVSINAGTDDLENVTISRISGPAGSVTYDGKTGINRKWNITSVNPPTNGRDLTFTWISDDDNGKNMETAQVWKNGAGPWVAIGTPEDVSALNPRSITVSTTSFSDWTVSDSDNPLPVELTSFTAALVNNSVVLNWQTATEVNNYGFSVERSLKSEVSSNNNGWIEIGFVEGHGNSNAVKVYAFTDKSVSAGTYSYRLKQIDTDGTYEYSQVVEVDISTPAEFSLEQNYPNPFNPVTVISYTLPVESRVTLAIYNLLGERVAMLVNTNQQAGAYNISFDASGLASGTYIYRLTAGEFVQTSKMLLMK